MATNHRSTHLLLREACAPAHARVDALFSGFALDDATHYRHFLRAHAEAVLPLEAALDAAGFAEWLPDWPNRRRGVALEADLAELGDMLALPQAISAPAGGAEWGLAYVLEGSRLGGILLARRLAPALPRRYLVGEGTPAAWRVFLQALEAALTAEIALAAAIQGALEAFKHFEEAGHRQLATLATVHIHPQTAQSRITRHREQESSA